MDTAELLALAQELVARLMIMDTAQALPGDGAMVWHDHREECADVLTSMQAGMLTMAVPA